MHFEADMLAEDGADVRFRPVRFRRDGHQLSAFATSAAAFQPER